MVRLVLGLFALALLALGSEGLYHANRGRHQATVSCDQFAGRGGASLQVRVTGCEIDFAGAAYRESRGQVAELFFPVRPAGRNVPAPLVAVTSHPGALKVAGSALGGGRQPSADATVAAMQKAAAAAGAGREIRGLVRAGFMQRMTARRVLSGIGVPLTAEVAIVDLHRTPDFMIPGLQLTGGLILVGLAFVASRRGAAAPETDEPEDSNRAEVLDRLHRQTAAFKTDVESPHVGPPSADSHADRAPGHTVSEAPAAGTTPRLEAVEAAVPAGAIDVTGPHAAAHALRLPAIMLLNVTGEADASAIEAAPPLGPKAEVLARLRDVLPDLEVDARGRARHEGPSHSVRLDIGPRDIVHTVVVEAEGETGLSIVRWIIESTGWRAFVPKRGRFVDADALGREAIDHHEA